MLSRENYIRLSLETNLFFLRIAKEHAIVAAASLPPRDMNLSHQLIGLKNNIEALLMRTVMLSRGTISPEVLSSGELVTDLTLQAEEKTQFLTGIPINTSITKMELALTPTRKSNIETASLFEDVKMINRQALGLMNNAIAFKEKHLSLILNCQAFSYVYPTMLHHIIEESRFYVGLLMKLENMDDLAEINEAMVRGIDWNHIMGEHAEFMRGYLDPSEENLMEIANAFAEEFHRLPPPRSQEAVAQDLTATTNLRNFKRQGTEGLLACEIKALIAPLLGDHLIREANHYLRLLKSLNK